MAAVRNADIAAQRAALEAFAPSLWPAHALPGIVAEDLSAVGHVNVFSSRNGNVTHVRCGSDDLVRKSYPRAQQHRVSNELKLAMRTALEGISVPLWGVCWNSKPSAEDGSECGFSTLHELQRGGTFDVWARRHGLAKFAAVVGALQQLHSHLAELHANGFVHRDLKPANIVMTEEARARTSS
jgi:serine/threonine protein kinase